MDLVAVLALKDLDRAGWVRVGVDRPESVAAHSWGVAWLVLATCPPELDRGKALAYAVIHDIAEVRVGDITPADGVTDKAEREAAAMREICAERPDLLAIWEAYEAQGDPEARYVRELDRLDMALQALAYHRRGTPGMLEFVESAGRVIRSPGLRARWEEIRREVAQPPQASS